jgi:Inner membrane protein YgaP-like, transmembrane domain
MSIDRLVMAFAGVFILASLLLAWLHSVYWLLFTGFVGLNLFQASFTGFCPLAIILKKMGLPSGVAFK